MNYNGDLGELDKPFSELCVISENQKTFQGVVRWNIPNCEIKKHVEGLEKPSRSNTFSIGSPSFCTFYFLFYPNIWDNVFDSPDCLKSLSLSIIFKAKHPDSVWIKGKINFEELNVHKIFSVPGYSFQKEYKACIPCNISDIDTLTNLCKRDQDLIMHCSLKIIIRQVKCTFDKRPIHYKESRNYDSSKETFKHNEYSDVSISIGHHNLMTHKTVLAQIPYFQELFDADESEKHFELTDIDYDVFNHVLTYLYSGDIPILSFKLASELYIVASDLKISSLKNLCSSYLGANLTHVNVVIVLKLSHDYEDIALKKECFKFIKRSDIKMLTEKSIVM